MAGRMVALVTAFLLLVTAASEAGESGRPLKRRAPYQGRQAPYGFLNLGGGVFDPSNQPGNGFYGVMAVGTEVSSVLDLGVQFSWYHRSQDGGGFNSTYVDPGGNIVTVRTERPVDTDLLPFMGIMRLRFPLSSGLQPYFGAGVGYEWLLVEGVDQDGFAFSNDYGGLGAQALGGLNIMVSPTVGLYGEGVYNWTNVEAEFFDPVYGVGVEESIDYDGWAVHGGFKFRF